MSDEIVVEEVSSVREQKEALKRREEAPAGATAGRDQPLYADRVKVYPRKVWGTFRRLKWAALGLLLAIYYLVPWIRWDRGPGAPDQAVLIDMPSRRAYFFFIEIWPQEVYYLTGLLILAAVGLFFVTSLAGRVWCGYACPQTVWTDLFMWVERLVEGDRNARMRLDRQPFSVGKLARKATKHGIWLLIAFVTGGAWIMYFKDAPTLVHELVTFRAAESVWLFIGLFTFTTYLLAGWAREQVCTYMCPWPRFQAAMFDEDTLIVTYQRWRGEPRGKLKKGENDDWSKRGDCIDCKACVAVCPTGIDIRDGQQLECINCALCIDACNDVMAKLGRPGELITYDTEANQIAQEQGNPRPRYKLIRIRTIFYALLFVGVATVMLGQLLFRNTLDINVLHDRNPLFVTLSNGDIRNGYTVKLLNKTREQRTFVLSFAGLPGATMDVLEHPADGDAVLLIAAPDSVATYDVQVRAPRSESVGESHPVTFTLTDPYKGETVTYKSVFRGPER
ncbi:cytochrome c oxidase accessory protein FixG [Tistlia consotensis]|uniref:Cytochrome c oxidase accessory protein FixG n=1 Tax=Tistlia consotensis USBA 355 TaxID=560819 RepID=A0A1Y6C7B4_9PROT|nr:cytochrome c oxidase accessory protein CcoG [Tistlia consotensis]SMF40445.1 cytochrome c oxidase accessory protein FixG [Tistlia consotensis USBA 355]SNR74935.1 cytochrome c oxidase accessory protein FixG [Tistlia consotensis]